jgi:hypothetical protein
MADSIFNTMEQDELLEAFNFVQRQTDLRGLALKRTIIENEKVVLEEDKIALLNELCRKAD